MAVSASPAPYSAEYTRLHITPLTPDLLNRIVPPSILPSARNISYHTIETFPERAYGFLELPVMDAEKIKKKLNGSILKGTKVKIEAARPAKEFVADKADAKPERIRKEGSKKRKRVDEVVPGVDIGERSVKRGWTTPTAEIAKVSKKDKDSKDKKDKKEKTVVKSKYTTGKECLFKTVLPPNVAAKTKSAKDEKPDKRRKGRPGKETVVHEFTKTTKYATFLRMSGSAGGKKTKAVAEFVEGKGWVDDEGNLVEEVLIKPRKIYEVQQQVSKAPVDEKTAKASISSDEETSTDESENEEATSPMDIDQAPMGVENDSLTSSSGSSSEDSESSSSENEELVPNKVDQTKPEPIKTKVVALASKEKSVDSSSDSSEYEDNLERTKVSASTEANNDSSSNSSSDSSEDENAVVEADPNPTKLSISVSRPPSSSGLSIKIPSPPAQATEIHPLEALYKRPKPDLSLPAEAAPPPFSFFGGDDTNEDLEEEAQDQLPSVLLTPYTRKDFEYRGLRSAAPTPDTAHANKRFIWPTENDTDDDVEQGSSPIRGKAQETKGKGKEDDGKAKTAEEKTDFQKWFWENRGDTNRAWKKRRKAVGKEKRQRENRKREGKGA